MSSENGLSFSNEAFGEYRLFDRNYDQLDREAGDLSLLASIPCEHPQDVMPARDARMFFALEDERRRISNFLLTLTTESERGEESAVGTVVYDENRILEIYGSQAELATVFSRQRGLLAKNEQLQSHLAHKIDVFEFQHCGAILTSFGGRNLMEFEGCRPNDDGVTHDFLKHVVGSLLLRNQEVVPDFEFDNQFSGLFPEIMKTHLENLSIITCTVIGGSDNVRVNGSKNKIISQHANRLRKTFGRLQRASRSALLSAGKHEEVCHAVSQILSHESVPDEYVVPAFVCDTYEMVQFYRDLSFLPDVCEDCCAGEIRSAIEEIVVNGEEQRALFVPHEMDSFFVEEADCEIDQEEITELFSRLQNAFDGQSEFEQYIPHEAVDIFSVSVSGIDLNRGKNERYFLKFEFESDEYIELCINVSDTSIDWNCLEEFSQSKHAAPLIRAALDVLSDYASDEDAEDELPDDHVRSETVSHVKPKQQKKNPKKRGNEERYGEDMRKKPRSIIKKTIEEMDSSSNENNQSNEVEYRPRYQVVTPELFDFDRFARHNKIPKDKIDELRDLFDADELPERFGLKVINMPSRRGESVNYHRIRISSKGLRKGFRVDFVERGTQDGKILIEPIDGGKRGGKYNPRVRERIRKKS